MTVEQPLTEETVRRLRRFFAEKRSLTFKNLRPSA